MTELEHLQKELNEKFDFTREDEAEYIIWLDCILGKIQELSRIPERDGNDVTEM